MNKRYFKHRTSKKIKDLIYSHLENNLKEYSIITIIFFIGIIIGIIYINHLSYEAFEEINSYIDSFIHNLKENPEINNLLILSRSLKRNSIITILLCFLGSTVIGIAFVYLTICCEGFCFGYTISSLIATLGSRKGYIAFVFFITISKYYIYSCNNFTCCKWNKTP